jgi:hypothetical protein
MPHGKIQLMFVHPSLNVGTCRNPPSINLQQETQYSHGIAKFIIGVSTLIQGVNWDMHNMVEHK